MASAFMVGESLVGEGNEVAHIDLLIGPKDGPVGEAFARAGAAARARDDCADAVEPALGRLRRAVRRGSYPSVPPANGWRASAAPSRTVCVEGSLPRARAIDSFVAW